MTLKSIIDPAELVWRCILRKQLEKLLAIILGCMSVAILLAEATLLPSGVDLSLFSILINAVGKEEVLVQIASLLPLMYMCVGTYYSLFKIGMLMFYSLTPRQTSSVSLLMICSMVARYAPPISYNYLNLIRLKGNAKTLFEKKMGNIDDAVPFFGQGFNKIYPLIMVVYTLLVASNFFDRVIDFFGSWKRLRIQKETDNMDGFDPSGMIILQKERSWLEQGSKVGEHVIPLARNFYNTTADVESSSSSLDKDVVEMKVASGLSKEGGKATQPKALKEENWKYGNSRDAIESKYAAIRDQQGRHSSPSASAQKSRVTSTSVSLLEGGSTQNQYSSANTMGGPSAKISSTWESMKAGFQNFKTNIEAKKFLPLRQVPEVSVNSRDASSQSLDEIFHRLKQHPNRDRNGDFSDDEDIDIRKLGPTR
eukprot:TRINITY_DN3102_c0_g1_i6.p1 TRINITY_DN3102_c0_g1~~TRINITY_DN3102_c0_g1_i6.p1  ORF type:complete len:424 (+),score=78.50 TRINITY_DN3102_c0_g1_i6:1518-2789(+)